MPLILTRIGRGTIIVAILVVFNLNENKLLLSIGSLSQVFGWFTCFWVRFDNFV